MKDFHMILSPDTRTPKHDLGKSRVTLHIP
jgi:hypothetical protein